MADCIHEGVGVCKSCKQTLIEGGNVQFREEAQPKPKPKPKK